MQPESWTVNIAVAYWGHFSCDKREADASKLKEEQNCKRWENSTILLEHTNQPKQS